MTSRRAESIVELNGVSKRFGDVVAVAAVNLALNHGEFFSLLGPSGCGKTTALRMIAGFQEPDTGDIRINGESMHGVPPNRRPTNMVFQNYAIFPHLDVGDNVAFGLRRTGIARSAVDQQVAEALEMVELDEFQSRRTHELSGGQRQRVALARALVMKPQVLLLDEPLSALDKKLRETMQLELRRLQRSIGITFVMVTHDQYEAMTMSDRIGVMFEGRLEQVAEPDALYSRPVNREVAAFIGGMNFLPANLKQHDDGLLQLMVPAFGTLNVAPNAQQSESTVARVIGIRPEQLTISRDNPANFDATASGTVTDVAFYGESIHYFIRVEGLSEAVVVAVPNYFHTENYQQGDTVNLGIMNESVIDLGGASSSDGSQVA